MNWPFAFVFGCLTAGVLGALYFYLENLRDQREHEQALRDLEDRIAGIIR